MTSCAGAGGTWNELLVARDGVEPSTSHFSGERSYQLSYLAATDLARDQPPRLKNPPRATGSPITRATPTGLEPAASAVTGRRSNQLSYGAKWHKQACTECSVLGGSDHRSTADVRDPSGIRTRAAAVKGRSPGPLDDGASEPAAVTR